MRERAKKYFEQNKQIYGNAIDWSTIFSKLKYFEENRDYVLTYELAEWQGFLLYLQYIENTIPTYAFYTTGVDDHTNWLVRIFRLFGRAELEERAVLASEFGKKYQLISNPKIINSGKFYTGAGKQIPDFIDNNKVEYDVKHENVDFSKAHGAKYIIKYSTSGTIELHDRDKTPSIVDAINYKSLSDLCDEVGINYVLISATSTEAKLESYLGVAL